MDIIFDLKKWGVPESSKDFDEFLSKIEVNGVHEIRKEDNPYHILVQDISLNNEYILIGLHGALERSKITPPAFFFRGVARESSVGLIAISDPSINISEKLHLGWYLGNNINKNITKEIAEFLDKLIEKTGKKIILTGGSGGGFAALNIHSHMLLANKAKSFVWNPQTDITKYNLPAIRRYFNVCVEEEADLDIKYIENKLIEKKIPYKVEQRLDLEQLIFINGYDHAHLRKHVRSYINSTGANKFRVFVGNWGYGHTQPPQKTIIDTIKSIINNKSLDEVINALPKPKKPILDFCTDAEKLEKIIDCRASVIRVSPKRLICLKANIYDHFIGFQTRFVVRGIKKEILFKSDYLLGANICELYLNSSIENIRKLSGSLVELYIEDIKGVEKVYKFEFDKIKEIHDVGYNI